MLALNALHATLIVNFYLKKNYHILHKLLDIGQIDFISY